MSPTVARTHGLRRLVASLALALIAATGINTATAPAASAAPALQPNASFAWTGASLTTDNGTVGVPDVGDVVTYTYTATVFDTSPSALESFTLWSTEYPAHESGLAIAPGTSQDFSVDVTVTASMLDDLHGGPYLSGATVTHKVSSQILPRSTSIAAPPVLYTAPSPIAVSTDFALTELHGVVGDGLLVQGDQVGEVTHVTNTSPVTLTVTGPASSTPAGPVSLAAGATQDFSTAPVTVTYAHMQAGGVAFAADSVSWSVGSLGDTVSFPAATAPTAPIDASFAADVATVVHTSAGAPVTMGGAVAGDHIDYTFQLTNTGNVVLDQGYFERSWSGVSGLLGYMPTGVALVQGASLPSGSVSGSWITSDGGEWPAYPLLQADIDRGYVDLQYTVGAAPTPAMSWDVPSTYKQTITKRVFLKDFNTKANLKFTDAVLNDTNGDGIGQEGETISFGVRFKNNADQPLMIDAAGEAAGWYLAAPLGGTFNGVTVSANGVVDKQWDYTITAADVARGKVRAKVFADYHGTIDSAADSRTNSSAKIATGVYVAPASTLDTAATYDDTNLDGFPSIGETVHVTVTVANSGGYPLTGLAVADAAGSDVTGLLPAFPASIAGGDPAVESFDYVLTAADFARGSLTYITEMTATGLPTTVSSTSVYLEGITFQAYATDLDAMDAGGIQVCESNGTPTDTITLLSTILVHPGTTCTYAGLPYGYRIVGFSTPLVMGTDTFSTTVPVALHVGAHRLALYAPDGTLVGWKAVTAKDPVALAGPDNGGALANTGANGDEAMNLGGDAVLLMLLGTAFVVADSRRRKHAGR